MRDITINKYWANHQVAEALYYSAMSVLLDGESTDIGNMYIMSSVSSVEEQVKSLQSSNLTTKLS